MKRLDVLAKEIGVIVVTSLLLAFSYNAFSPKPLPLIRSAAETQAPDSLINALALGVSETLAQKKRSASDGGGAQNENTLRSAEGAQPPATETASQIQEEKLASAPVSVGGKAIENSGAGTAAQNPDAGASATAKALDIRLDQLEKLLSNPEVLLIDARPTREFEQGHISGAINIFTPDFEQSIHRVIGLPREKPIVAYCGGGACELSHELAEHLIRMGFQRVFVYTGGWNEWKEKKR